jgi:DNA-binding transcriptional regulator YbjK
MDAMRRATFVGMTEDEVRQYEQRRARIGELVKELGVITSQRAA